MNPAIPGFLAERTIAVVGVSRGRGFANGAARTLRARGWQVFPVNEAADEVDGERCWRSLDALPARPGAVLVVVPPARAAAVVRDCARLGIRHVWLQQGAESDDALRAAAEAGLDVVHHACILMHAQPRGLHRFHRWVEQVRGRI